MIKYDIWIISNNLYFWLKFSKFSNARFTIDINGEKMNEEVFPVT